MRRPSNSMSMSGRTISFPIRVSVAIGPFVVFNIIEVDGRTALEIWISIDVCDRLATHRACMGTHRLPIRVSVTIGPLEAANSIEVDVRSALEIWGQY